MLDLGPLAFASPWLLLGLLALPALWWLLRVLPPAPRRVASPVNRLLAMLRRSEETPAHTPLWLILLRLVIAGLVIVAVAHPLMNPATTMPGSGPLVLVVDDGWAAARNWTERETAMFRPDRPRRADPPAGRGADHRPAAGRREAGREQADAPGRGAPHGARDPAQAVARRPRRRGRGTRRRRDQRCRRRGVAERRARRAGRRRTRRAAAPAGLAPGLYRPGACASPGWCCRR